MDKLIGFITLIEKRNRDVITISSSVKKKMNKYKAFRDQILEDQGVSADNKILSFSEYFKHIINNGNDEEKKETLGCIKQPLYIHNGEIFSNPLV